MHLLSDAMFGAPSVIFADAVARNNSKCWMYRFDYEGVDARRGALHAADMCFFWERGIHQEEEGYSGRV